MRSARQVILVLGICAVLLAVTFVLVSMRYAACKLDRLRGFVGFGHRLPLVLVYPEKFVARESH